MDSKSANKEIGHLVSYFSGVGKIQGLPHVSLHELLLDQKGREVALVLGFDENFVEALFFEEDFNPEEPVFRSLRVFSVPQGRGVLGRVLNGLGQPLDNLEEIEGKQTPVFRLAPPLVAREPVQIPLTSGLKIIDATLPLGRGQRELIIGDRKLGKTTLALDIILNQKDAQPPVYCFYVLCGQKKRQLREIYSLLEREGALLYSSLIAAPAESSLASQYLAPFVGCTLAEYFRDRGEDALIVYDDLTKHAKVYRDIALLLSRPAGREAYPGDIFSLHAQLLERAGKLSPKHGGGSLTALPIAETQEGDITSFIPTNLISITDGQIYLERGLFQKGFLPAVNVGLSVSRVGAKAQPPPLKEVTAGLRLSLSQHKQLQKLTQLETVVSEETKRKIHRGDLILELLKQEKHRPLSWEEQTVLFYILNQGYFDDLPKEKWAHFERFFLDLVRSRYLKALAKIGQGRWDYLMKRQIALIANDFKNEFLRKEE